MAVQPQVVVQPDRGRLVLEQVGKTEELDRASTDHSGFDHVGRWRQGAGVDRCGELDVGSEGRMKTGRADA